MVELADGVIHAMCLLLIAKIIVHKSKYTDNGTKTLLLMAAERDAKRRKVSTENQVRLGKGKGAPKAQTPD